MSLIIQLSELNIMHDTGGPFAAGVFEKESGRLISVGVNRVVEQQCSSAHAEVMAISLAQQAIRHWDLGNSEQPVHQLVVNWRPCAMCYGATLWSGIRSLAIAGSGPELEAIAGFDEGPLSTQWQEQLELRGIEVINNVLTQEAIAVFKEFRARKKRVYNSRQSR